MTVPPSVMTGGLNAIRGHGHPATVQVLLQFICGYHKEMSLLRDHFARYRPLVTATALGAAAAVLAKRHLAVGRRRRGSGSEPQTTHGHSP